MASISSVGLWFELILMQMMVRDLYDEDPRSDRMHYALTEIGDECRHSLMFGKAIDRCGAPAYGPTPRLHRLGRLMKTVGYGVSGYASILVAEEILDRWQREVMGDDRVRPLVRMVSRIHVLEEARHMTFARDQIERMLPRLNRATIAWHQAMLGQTAILVARALVNPAIYEAVGLDPVAARWDGRAGQSARQGDDGLDGGAGHRLPDGLGLIPRHQRELWRRSLLSAEPQRTFERNAWVRSCCGLPSTSRGGALLDDHPAVHEDQPVGDLAGEAHLVGDDHHRHALRGEVLHDAEHVADELGVEGAGRLVEQHHLGVHRQRPGDGDPLLLAAGELGGVGARPSRRGPTLSRLRRRDLVGLVLAALRAPAAGRW